MRTKNKQMKKALLRVKEKKIQYVEKWKYFDDEWWNMKQFCELQWAC